MAKLLSPLERVSDKLSTIHTAMDALFKHTTKAVDIRTQAIRTTGKYVRTGTMAHSGTGRALSASSGTEATQNTYEPVNGEIVLERKRVKGCSGNHVSINPTCEMFGVITPPN